MVDELDQGFRGKNIHLLARPGGLRAGRLGADQAEPVGMGGHGGGKGPGDGKQAAIQRQFAHDGVGLQEIRGDDAQRREKGERDGQVVVAAFLGQVGGREVDDGEALARKGEADGMQRGPHPLAAFAHRLVGQADHGESRLPAGELRLAIDENPLHPLEGNRCNPRCHDPTSLHPRR